MPLPGRLLTAMVTPFDADLRLDLPRARFIAKQLIKSRSTGVVVSGTTGESPTLSHEEKLSLIEAVVAEVGGTRVVAGTGSNDTAATIALSQEAERLGVCGLLLIAPYYNKPDQEGLYHHFKAVAKTVEVPIILYNHPPRTGVAIAPATVARLARECRNIIALKDSSGSLDMVSEFIKATPKDFLLFSGNDTLTLPIVAVGGYGAISVAAHVAGPEIMQMIDLAAGGSYREAQKIHYHLWDLMNALFMAPSPAPTKAALAFYGGDVGGVRLPLLDMEPAEKQVLEDILERTLGPSAAREVAKALVSSKNAK